MPSPPDDDSQKPQSVAGAKVSDASYIAVATNTFSDLAAFCARQPGVCETAGFVAHKLELKAKYGVRLIYNWASEANPTSSSLQPDVADGADPIKTGSMKLASAKQSPPASQTTLHLEDLIPVWHNPSATKNS